MPVPTNPPAIYAPAPVQAQTPLMSEMIKRAVNTTPLADPSPTPQPSPVNDSSKSFLEKIGTPAFLGGVGADWASTAYGLSHGLGEDNPMINWVPSDAGKIALGAGIDAGGYLLMKHLLKNHPKLFNAGLLVSGGLRGALAGRNLHRVGQIPPDHGPPTPPGFALGVQANPPGFGK